MARKARIGYRDAVDGQFVTKREAEDRPRETVREHIPLPGNGVTDKGHKKK